ncbi:hypothetical protein C0993_001123 [Termitomyces sp. T159_Od127]|nr:hypothetical protein C0993_001123 [Termitomyces sp. T159_Od127]
MALSSDTPLAPLPSQSFQTLLLHTTLPQTSAPVNTLVDSSATDNFIDKSLATLAVTLQKLPLPIGLTLFDGSSTSTGNITHYVQTTLIFVNGQWQDLQLLMTCLHVSTPLILGLLWLRSTNPHVNCKSFQVLTALIDSRATRTFVSDQLNLTHDLLDRPMESQLFDSKPTTAGPITKTHTSSIVLDNGLWFGSWLHDVNPDIDWKDLTMKFSGPGACFATINLHLQLTDDPSKAGATSAPTTPLDDSGNPPPPQHTLDAPPAFPLNILRNKYKGPKYPTHHSWMTPDTDNVDQPPKFLDPDALDIKIISLAPFACIIQDGISAFQLYISLALSEEHLGADTTASEPKTEEQLLYKVVPPEYHEFTDVFSEGSAKELPPHQLYDQKSTSNMALHPPLARSTTCWKSNSTC